VAVIVGSALLNPLSLVQGLLMKIAIVVILGKGVKSALAARRIELAR
jgi:hypothetical protein